VPFLCKKCKWNLTRLADCEDPQTSTPECIAACCSSEFYKRNNSVHYTFPRIIHTHTNIYTHTRDSLMALCPGLPGWAGTRKVKPIWILLKQETVSGRLQPCIPISQNFQKLSHNISGKCTTLTERKVAGEWALNPVHCWCNSQQPLYQSSITIHWQSAKTLNTVSYGLFQDYTAKQV